MKKNLVTYIIYDFICLLCILSGCKDSENSAISPSLEIDKSELLFSGYSDVKSVKVDATRAWTAIASDYWITITPDHYPGLNDHFVANMAVTVADNETGSPREGTVTFFLGEELVATLAVKQDIPDEGEIPEEKFPINWAYLQWEASLEIKEGNAFEAGACVFIDGITNAMESTTGEDIVGEIGYSVNNSDPSGEDWVWSENCWFNGDWGDNFYYQAKIEDALAPGIYYFTFRFRKGIGIWKYAGTNGLWNGVESTVKSFEVKEKDEETTDPVVPENLKITWANLQWFDSNEIAVGGKFNAGSKVKADGWTDVIESKDGSPIICELGYSNISSDPHDEGWVWVSCPFNGDWGTDFYFQGYTEVINELGEYNYTFRYKLKENGEYVYAGSNGLWDGTNNICGKFTVK